MSKPAKYQRSPPENISSRRGDGKDAALKVDAHSLATSKEKQPDERFEADDQQLTESG